MFHKKAKKQAAARADSVAPGAAVRKDDAGKSKAAKTDRAFAKGADSAPASGKEHLKAPASAAADPDLSSPKLYLNRELTWLRFNSRVLSEAADNRTPLLERVKFLAITGSNLDEFFMKRIGGLMQQVGAGVTNRTIDGLTPLEQIDHCAAYVRTVLPRQQKIAADLIRALKSNQIYILCYADLSAAEKKQVRSHYSQFIFPLVTPQSVDPAHPFPFISNLSLNLLVTFLQKKNKPPVLARVRVPLGYGAPRFIRLNGTGSDRFIPLEDVMRHNLDLLFPGVSLLSCEVFRTTRNSNTESREENADDLMAMIESELQERRFAPIVRLEVEKGMEPNHRGLLAAELGLDLARDVYESESLLGLRDLMELVALDRPMLKDSQHHPVDHPDLAQERSIFHTLRDAGSILVQHPYETFSSTIERLLREAARDPKVHAIKMTLYRTASESNFVEHLIEASVNGAQVAVVVELQASFDEAANIRLAERMEEAGIHVTYGVLGLKTHTKIILVVRRDFDGLRRYVHVGTGNYHPITSRLYTDIGLFTVDPDIGADATEVFNYLTTGVNPSRNYKKLLVAPSFLKKAFIDKIEREAALHTSASPGLIQFKMNALEDVDITRALYRAAHKGVRVDLIVRDSCRIRPGVKGLSENIRVISIVGRFLEHARIYYFRNGGQEEYYIGSADCMKRNLENRVEVVTPVESKRLQKRLREILDVQFNDRRSAWDMQPDGEYVQRKPSKKEESLGSHDQLIMLAEKRVVKAQNYKDGKKKKS
jgi:polyphosphate kinase